MRYLPMNTLAFLQRLPQVQRQAQVGSLPIAKLASATKSYVAGIGELPVPDLEAVEFYAANHCVAYLRGKFTENEPLTGAAAQALSWYIDALAQQSERMVHYLIQIITREARHLKNNPHDLISLPACQEQGGSKPTTQMGNFVNLLRDKSESAAVATYVEQAPAVTASQYVEALMQVFDLGSWKSGYGGKAWGEVARALLDFLKGNTSLEMLVDTAYTLAHNNGPIFNKGMCYTTYTGRFIMVLDAQRSGQVPELVLDEANPSHLAKHNRFLEVRHHLRGFKEQFPDAFSLRVDWDKVVAHGALGAYPEFTKKTKATPVKETPKKVSVCSAIAGVPCKQTGDFAVWPGVTLPILSRVTA